MKDNKSTVNNYIKLIKSQVNEVIKKKNMASYAHEPPQKFIKACRYMVLKGKLIGLNTDVSLQDFLTALIRESSIILDDYGVIVKQKEIFLNYEQAMDDKENTPEQVQRLIFYIDHVINVIAEKDKPFDKQVQVNYSDIKKTWNKLINNIAIQRITYPWVNQLSRLDNK